MCVRERESQKGHKFYHVLLGSRKKGAHDINEAVKATPKYVFGSRIKSLRNKCLVRFTNLPPFFSEPFSTTCILIQSCFCYSE